jgi:hypothetical protein
MSKLLWPSHLVESRDRTKFLNEHRSEIPNESHGRRRMVDAAAFVRYWSKADKAAFESLDAANAPPVVPETVSTAEYLENVAPLYRKVLGQKQRK